MADSFRTFAISTQECIDRVPNRVIVDPRIVGVDPRGRPRTSLLARDPLFDQVD